MHVWNYVFWIINQCYSFSLSLRIIMQSLSTKIKKSFKLCSLLNILSQHNFDHSNSHHTIESKFMISTIIIINTAYQSWVNTYLAPIVFSLKKSAPKSYLMNRTLSSSGSNVIPAAASASLSLFTWKMVFFDSMSLIWNSKKSIPYTLALRGQRNPTIIVVYIRRSIA